MAAMALSGGPRGPHRRRSPVTLARVMAVGGIAVAAFLVWTFLNGQIVTTRPNDMKTTTVVLPPPPPPPPPEVKPEEKPPEPTDAPPVDDPVDTPPPPEPQQQQQAAASEPVAGDNALTAREGAGPSNYGLAAGDGGGLRIGGKAGGGSGNGFAAYARVASVCAQTALQADRELSRNRYTAQLAVRMDPEGRIVSVDPTGSDSNRNARIRQVLTGIRCAQRPPEGLPSMRFNVSTRSGA